MVFQKQWRGIRSLETEKVQNNKKNNNFKKAYNSRPKPYLLMVINDDKIAANTGFDTHPHQNMEIITYVRKGAITHKDNKGNQGRTTAGNVQVMSAGTGIYHSEFNLENEETNIYQIWIKPKINGVEPNWNMAEFPKQPVTDSLQLLVSGEETSPLNINQDARIYAGRMNKSTKITHNVIGKAYVLISEGNIEVNGNKAQKGDGLSISDETSLDLEALNDAEVLIIEVPGKENAR